MPSGIIISTSTPVPGSTFPRNGGTAIALQRATQLPIVSMHTDAKARPEEISHFKKLSNGSIVYITGQLYKAGSTLIRGVCNESGSTPVGSIDMSWKLEDIRDLILENASLQSGDKLTIVLWMSNAAENSPNSTAVKLARSFREKGIYVTIISSKGVLDRFDGSYGKDEDPSHRLRFRTHYSSIRSVSCIREDIIETTVEHPIYFTRLGIENLSPSFSHLIQETHSQSESEIETSLKRSLSYRRIYTPQEAFDCLRNENIPFVAYTISQSYPGVRTVFSVDFFNKDKTGIFSLRYAISEDDLLFAIPSSGGDDKNTWQHVTLKSAYLVEETLQQHVESIVPPPILPELLASDLYNPSWSSEQTGKILLQYRSLPFLIRNSSTTYPSLARTFTVEFIVNENNIGLMRYGISPEGFLLQVPDENPENWKIVPLIKGSLIKTLQEHVREKVPTLTTMQAASATPVDRNSSTPQASDVDTSQSLRFFRPEIASLVDSVAQSIKEHFRL
ncbi:TPA: hypothetical protein ACT9K3_000641 [Legionella pneumophila]